MGQSTHPSLKRQVCLYHTSPRKNLKSLLLHGVQVGLARGKLLAVWTVEKRLIGWSVNHVQHRHSTDKTVVLEMRVPAADLTKRKDGVFTLSRDVHSAEITGIITNGHALRIYTGNA
jgi:hypothetical protein